MIAGTLIRSPELRRRVRLTTSLRVQSGDLRRLPVMGLSVTTTD